MDEPGISKTTRQRVLDTLLKQQRCTINELAAAVEINPVSVRHHISRLEAEGLVTSTEERHGVGRPRRSYFLTENGMERFPTRYMRLTMRLLEQMKDSMPSSMVESLFSQMARDVIADYQGELEGLSMDERLKVLKEMLNNEGFNIEWELEGDQYHIRETNCPYYHVGQNHPEVCSVDQTLISSVLALPAEKVQCMLHGDQTCTYIVPSSIQIKEPSA